MSTRLELPNIDAGLFHQPDTEHLHPAERATHAPRILLLYGSLRERSYSRLLTEEAARLLQALGAEPRIFDPRGLPMPDDAPKITRRCRNCATWRNGPKAWSGPRPSATAP